MMNLLIIREHICKFCQKYDRIFVPLCRFLYAFLVFISWKQLFGYNDMLYKLPYMIGGSFVCAFVPSGVIFILSGVLACVDLMSLSAEVAVLVFAFYLVSYFLYLRLIPRKSWIIACSPVFLMRLPCLLPLVVAMLVGPAGIVPVLCGIVLYYISVHAHELEPLLVASTDSTKVSPLNYLVQSVLADREMLLFMVVFSVVIMITYLIYRSSMKHAWILSIILGGVIMMIALLGGSFLLEDELSLGTLIIGCVISAVIAALIQFFRCIVDYSRTEHVQFEDDDYYYYVKAVPKLAVTQTDVNIQKINVRQKK